jgi:MFS family permease
MRTIRRSADAGRPWGRDDSVQVSSTELRQATESPLGPVSKARVRCGDLLATNLNEPSPGASGEAGFWGVAGMYLLIQVGGTIPIPLWVLWQSKLGFGTGTLTLVFAIYTLGTLVSLLLLAPLSDRVGRRPVLVLAVALAAASTVVYLVADTVLLLFVARFISGAAVALTTAAGAAALRELEPGSRARRASLTTAAVTMGGLALGPLLAGVMAEYAHDPLRLVFWIYLALLVPALIAVLRTRETVPPDRRVAWRPGRIALPRDRSAFAIAAATAFCAFTLLGLYSSLVPSFLRSGLHVRNHAVAGLIVSMIFVVGTITQLLLFRISPKQALTSGLLLLLVGLALIELGLWNASLAIFIGGTIAGGLAVGLLFMGSLAIVNQIAEPERRAQVLATYFVCTYAGLAVPAITVGEATDSIGANKATLVCAIAIAVLALRALNALLRRRDATAIGSTA